MRTRRRWHRAAIPLGLALLLFAITGVTHAIDEPDPTEPGFLSPLNHAPTGGDRLGDELRARGVTVLRMTRTSDALVAAYEGGATLFVPAPALVHPDYVAMLALMPTTTRVVLVDPPRRVLAAGRVPLATTDRRWATLATDPGSGGQPCPLTEAREAGAAAVLRQRYTTPTEGPAALDRCYAAGLVRLRWNSAELVVVGASDPFRNDRIDEHNNAALAAGLLAARPRVIWLDLAAPEPRPGMVDTPVDGAAAPPSLAPDPDRQPDPDHTYPADRPPPPGPPGTDADGDEGSAAQAQPHNPLWDAFPPWFWALLVQLALAALVVALWRARRLGPPVAEPLPVAVASAETVLGRGRLYRRARARGPAADILRGAALAGIVPLLDLPPDATPREVVAAVAAQTGQPPQKIDTILYGPAPTTDDELLQLARALDALPHAVSAPPLDPPDRSDEGEDR